MKKTMIILGLTAFAGTVTAMNKPSKGYAITFNSPTDATLIINDGMSFSNVTNLSVNNVTSVVFKKRDGSVIKDFSDEELSSIKTINVAKDKDTGEYLIETKE